MRTRRFQGWVALVLLPALAFRLLLPDGFMPRFGADHELSMQMCHGDAQSSAVLRLLGDPRGAPDRPHDGSHEGPCAFAAAGSVAPPAPPLAAPLVALPSFDHALPTSTAAPLLQPHRPQSARAPPMPT